VCTIKIWNMNLALGFGEKTWEKGMMALVEILLKTDQLYKHFKEEYHLSRTDILLLCVVEKLKKATLYKLDESLSVDRSLIVRRIRELEREEYIYKTKEGRCNEIHLRSKANRVIKEVKRYRGSLPEERI